MKGDRHTSHERPDLGAPATQSGISRRAALRQVGLGIGLLAGCSDDSAERDPRSTGGTGGTPVVVPGSLDAWATGGTAAMTDVESYPDPFAAAAASCALLCTLTQGPCWGPTAPVRQDVSEGEPGVPLRLALRIVQADGCTPVVGAEVEIWYCNIDGLYSGDDLQDNALAFCTSDNEHALSGYFFRGRALSDEDGKLSFHGCFPGWYPGRSIHIHILVRPAASAGEATTNDVVAMSQLFFPEELTAEIFGTVSGYVDKGQPDTSFARDGVLGAVDDIAPYVVEYQRMTDGALLAWKTIAISAATSC